jgi:hypothetical protein
MTCAFSGIGAMEVLHCLLWHFISGLYCKHHDSSPVITLPEKVVSFDQMMIQVRTDIKLLLLFLVIKFAETILFPNLQSQSSSELLGVHTYL